MGLNDFTITKERALPIFILADTSGSMKGEKIQVVNLAVRDMIATLRNVNDIRGVFKISIITFGGDKDIVQQYKEEPSKRRNEYTFEHYSDSFSDETLRIYDNNDKKIMNLDSCVKKEFTKLYIAYKAETNFVDVIPQKSALFLNVSLDYDKVNDPKGLCENIADKGRWGNGTTGIHLINQDQIDDVIAIISQALDAQITD